ncbi:Putative two-component sensor histidine kinase, classical system [Magnetospirillum molischianum DSM 120]|uniref:histidine kinase n=1 Tax=Magnetospirillum molischianum DSM 120 TaxID=1150626 RepID=H8FNG9_MAGML|nr:Putative two-component sensor histidine kinase, classical system [Magnetospirillum molischianum DSM 120]
MGDLSGPGSEAEETAVATRAAMEAEIVRLTAECRSLRDAETRSREFAATAADWFWETNPAYHVIWLSDGFENTTGLSPASLLGRRPWDFACEAMEIDSNLWQEHVAVLAARQPFRDFKYWQQDSSGHARWIKVSGAPRFAADGSFSGYYGVGADITSAVSSAHRMHMLSRAVEQCPASIVITDLDGEIQYVNLKFIQVTGYSAIEAMGRNPRILNSGLNPPGTFEEMWQALSSGRKWEGELINRRKSGELYWEYASIQPIQNIEGIVTNYLAIKSDITSQKHNEARLAALVEELRHSNDELEQFAYVASHDLRQPLRMISAYLGLLEKRLAPVLDGETHQFLGFALDGAKRLDRMIVDLLQYSRIGRVTTLMESVDLGDALRDSLRHLEVAIAESGAEVRVEGTLPVCHGDRLELMRLFQNLICNAINYARPGHPPRVVVSNRDAGDEWVVTVEDNGIGIAQADLGRVFGIFQRLVTRDKVDGTGIGLAVSRKIVEHHGGRIWVESQPDVGSRFLFALPKSGVAASSPHD